MIKNAYLVFLFYFISLVCSFELARKREESRGIMWPKSKTLFGPGYGWDYLTATVSGFPLINITFFNEQKTNDQKFLVPDCFVVEDRKLANFYDSSEVIESSSQYSDVTSKSMHASLSGSYSAGLYKVSVSGSYSSDFQSMMDEQTKSKTVTIRSSYFDHRYTLLINSDCKLNKGFEDFILEIADCLKNNDTEWATYLAEEVVRDYGTHFIKKVAIGGIFYLDDFLSTSYWFKSENTYSATKLKASLSFKSKFFKADASYEQSNSNNQTFTQDFSREVKITKAQAIGGEFKPGYRVDDWAKTLDDNLAIIDKEADKITSFITYYNFQSIPRKLLAQTRALIDKAIRDYLEFNLIDGCLDRKSVNYQPFSNYHDPFLCMERYITGGFFEIKKECLTCPIIKTETVTNFITKDTTCPDGYTPIVHSFNKPNMLYNFTECKGEEGFEKSPILFGGIFTLEQEDNPVTNSKSCPPGFLRYGILQEKAFICYTRDFETGIPYAIPFMGFLSTCNISDIKKLKCDTIYEKRFVGSFNGCFLYYCSRVKVTEKRPIKKPPFKEMPQRNYYKMLDYEE